LELREERVGGSAKEVGFVLSVSIKPTVERRRENDMGKQNYGYGWHISDLVIYDQPKALGEFSHTKEYINKQRM
jgi:hypothetical protein